MNTVVYISDSGYYIPTLVSISSLICSVKDESDQYAVACIYKGFSAEQKARMADMQSGNVTIKLIDADNLTLKGSEILGDTYICNGSATPAALIKFSLADIFQDTNKLLYVDGDTIIKRSPSDLFRVDLGNNYAGVVLDIEAVSHDSNIEVLKRIPNYFNSGVMLLNAQLLREREVCLELYSTKRERLQESLMDQNVLNEVFNGKTVLLPIKYNYQLQLATDNIYLWKLSIAKFNDIYRTDYMNWDQVTDDAVVLHYASGSKPWKFSDAPGVAYWDRYYSDSPLAHKPLKRKKLNMESVYNIFRARCFRRPLMILLDLRRYGFNIAYRRYAPSIKARIVRAFRLKRIAISEIDDKVK